MNRRWREANPDRVAEYRRARRENPEAYQRALAQNREAKQLKSRLQQLGVPPKQVRRTPAAERRKNLAKADDFFTRQRIKTEYAPTPRDLLDQWARFSALVRRRFAEHERVGKYLERHGDRLRAEAVLDSRAREVHGKPPLYVEAEVIDRARKAVSAEGFTKPDPTMPAAERNEPPQTVQRSRAAGNRDDPNTGPQVVPGISPHHGPGLA